MVALQEFFTSMMNHPGLVRNIAVIGHIHHGKTTLIDNLVEQTHFIDKGIAAQTNGFNKGMELQGRRYTDTRKDEQKRGLSIKASPITLLLQSPSEKAP